MTTRKGRQTRERLLHAAQGLFRKKGYQGTSMREIAQAVGLREASLYYYAPGGKEQLFVEVVSQELATYREGILQAIGQASPQLEAQLRSVAVWLLSQPPPPLFRLFETDAQFLSPTHREALYTRLAEDLYRPLAILFRNAQIRGEIRAVDPIFLATQFLSTLIGLHHARSANLFLQDDDALITTLLDGLLHGLAPPPPDATDTTPSSA